MKRRDPRFIVAKKKPLKTSNRGNHIIRPVYITGKEEHIPVPLTNEQEVTRKQSLRNFHKPVTRKQSLMRKHEVLANKQQEEQSLKRKCVMKTGKVATTQRKTTIRNEPATKKQPKDATISKNKGGSLRKKITNEAGNVCNNSTEKGNNKKNCNANEETT